VRLSAATNQQLQPNISLVWLMDWIRLLSLLTLLDKGKQVRLSADRRMFVTGGNCSLSSHLNKRIVPVVFPLTCVYASVQLFYFYIAVFDGIDVFTSSFLHSKISSWFIGYKSKL